MTLRLVERRLHIKLQQGNLHRVYDGTIWYLINRVSLDDWSLLLSLSLDEAWGT